MGNDSATAPYPITNTRCIMKKIILSLVALLATMPALAQFYPDGRPIPPSKRGAYYNQRSQPNANRYRYGTRISRYGGLDQYFGFRIGPAFATVHSDSPALDGSDVRTGLNVSFVYGTQLTTQAPLYLETGIGYAGKGGKNTYKGSDFTYALDYIEIPLLLKYKYYATPDISIEPFAGGYFAVGVGGQIKDYGERAAYSSFDDDDDSAFRRCDAGLKVGCGVSFQMFYMGLSYDIGLANVGHDDFDTTHTGSLNLDFGVTF